MRKAVSIIAFFAFALVAWADVGNPGYLYWMVDTSWQEPALEFNYAAVRVSGTDTYLTMSGTPYTDVMSTAFDGSNPDALGTKTLATYADLGVYNSDAYSFAVELFNAEDKLVGFSSPVGYAALAEFVYGDIHQTGVDPYVFTAAAVPEPTGGMLFAFGLALLALRRKRV